MSTTSPNSYMMSMNKMHFDRPDMSKNIDNFDEFTLRIPSEDKNRKRQQRQDDDNDDDKKMYKKSTKADASLDTTKIPAHPNRCRSNMDMSDGNRYNMNNPTLLLLPDDLLAQVGTFLNVGSLKTARIVCRRFNRILSNDSAGWVQHCHRLWSRKVHVSIGAMAVLRRGSDDEAMATTGNSAAAMEAYRQSCFDGRLRHVIRREELIYDPTCHGGTKGSDFKTIWSFRFKESAGRAWTRFDPWHNRTGPARRMVFLPNGQVAQVVDDHDRPGGNMNRAEEDDSSYYGPLKLCRPFSDDDDNDNNDTEDSDDDEDADDDEEDIAPSGLDIRWRIVTQPMDLPPRGDGHQGDSASDDGIAYIRLTVAGRDVPTYIVHRSPTGNWGFLMENCWGVFASFPLPCKTKYTAPTPSKTDVIRGAPKFNVAIEFPSFPPPQVMVPSERNESSSSSFSAFGGGVQQALPSNNNEYSATENDDILLWLDDDWLSESNEDSDNGGAADDSRRLGGVALSCVHQQQGRRHSSSAAAEMKMRTIHLLEDAFLTVTNHWQWREALLYNMGFTSRLPDGPHAVAEFDRIWRLSMMRGMPMMMTMTTTDEQPYNFPENYSHHLVNTQRHGPPIINSTDRDIDMDDSFLSDT